MRGTFLLTAFIASALLGGCSSGTDDGTVAVAIIDVEENLIDDGVRLSFGGQQVRAATAEGLVSINAQGEVVPAIAERWIVTDDGRSFIFRIRGSNWADGQEISANSVRQSLLRAIRELEGTSLGLDLAKIDEIRAMTARVIEVRLKNPMPEFLQLLAQPELGLRRGGTGVGPMVLSRRDGHPFLRALPPQDRGLPEQVGWEDQVLGVRLRALGPQEAVDAFRDGEVEAVFNGHLSNLPLADPGPLSRGTIRIDAALGVFGLAIRSTSGVLETAELREALSMAVDRSTLMQPFNLAGWIATTRIVPPGLPGEPQIRSERWAEMDFAQRQSEAARRISSYSASRGSARMSIALPAGPGSDLLFQELATDWRAIGVTLERVNSASQADLVLFDRLARYPSARWYLNQFNCDLWQPVCSPDADVLVDQSLDAATIEEVATLLTEAENALTSAEAFIPLGAPIRWSLVRGGLEGFSENAWARHPLYSIATAPIP
ncbi:ABC transporter substrate-binding protein [Altererythrobacter sp.]|nr:ABC transporter substrate-binding protein [Altererythrobacter sp.]